MTSPRFRVGVGVAVGLALLTAACGGDDTGRATDSTVAEATVPEATVPEATAPGATVPEATVAEATVPGTTEPDAAATPTAIVSLSPTATEMLYAIGAGDQVLAVDDFSTYPPEAADKMQGLSGYTPNVEAIVGLEPDLVITDGTNPDLLAQLDSLGVPTWSGPAAASFDDVYDQILGLGAVTGRTDAATELVAAMQAEVESVKAALPELAEPLTYYHELDSTFFSVTSDTFIGAVYAEIGLVNVADAVGDGNPYPQLSAEFIIAEDPDLIFLACTKYCGETAGTVAARDGWGALAAVQNGNVIEMDDDIASRWGPRIVEYLRIAGEAVATAASDVAGG